MISHPVVQDLGLFVAHNAVGRFGAGTIRRGIGGIRRGIGVATAAAVGRAARKGHRLNEERSCDAGVVSEIEKPSIPSSFLGHPCRGSDTESAMKEGVRLPEME